MSRKKDDKELSEQEKLNQRVDAMLDPKLAGPHAAQSTTAPPLDIFKDAPADVARAAKTAPEVSGKLLDTVDDIDEEPAPSHKKSAPVARPNPQPQPQPTSDPPKDPVEPGDPLNDIETDEAVSDIASKEGNTLLALQDAIGRKASHVAGELAEGDRRQARRRHWAWFIFLLFFLLLVLLALPLNPHTCRWPLGIRLRVTTDILPSVCK